MYNFVTFVGCQTAKTIAFPYPFHGAQTFEKHSKYRPKPFRSKRVKIIWIYYKCNFLHNYWAKLHFSAPKMHFLLRYSVDDLGVSKVVHKPILCYIIVRRTHIVSTRGPMTPVFWDRKRVELCCTFGWNCLFSMLQRFSFFSIDNLFLKTIAYATVSQQFRYFLFLLWLLLLLLYFLFCCCCCCCCR